MNILSLCDGMSCGQIALRSLGIKIDNYFAAEIKPIAIEVTKYNYPNTIHIGDVNKITYKDGVLYTENGEYKTNIDLVLFGSPCQSFSIAMKNDKRIGLQDKKKSGLFIECYRILKEVNPTYFLVENVASMKKEDKEYISTHLGVDPLLIDSAIVAPVHRKRLYWTNIPVIGELKNRNICINDILENGYFPKEKGACLFVSDSRPLKNEIKIFKRFFTSGFTSVIFKSKEHYKDCVNEWKSKNGNEDLLDKDVFEGVRYLNQKELENCQTVPCGYTSCLSRNKAADVLGDGWTIEVIKFLFKGLIEVE